ncbi:MAG: response regulator transcription factor [Rubrobacteraceae bacterium]|nr:response regulator transcription factor [Rubrobacteraceae bacterium]
MVDDSQAPSVGNRAIRVLIVDDQSAVRRGLHLRLSLEPEVEVIGETGDGAEAISLAGYLQPDVVLMDVRMPGMDGIEATAALRAVSQESAVVILSLDDDAKTRTRAKEAGAVAFIAKRRMEEELLAVVRRAAFGRPEGA